MDGTAERPLEEAARHDPPHRRDRLPRHGGPRAAARAHATDEIVCLVRAPTTRPPQARLDDVLATLYGDADAAPRPRERDRRRPDRRRRAAGGPIDVVCHCAASISFDLPLEEARAINVEGTRAMLGSRARAGARRFVHVSTAYVAGTHAGRFTEDMLGDRVPQHLRADQVRGGADRRRRRATWRSRSRGRASSSASPTRAGPPPSTSSTGRCARSRAGCSSRSRRGRDGRVDVVPVDYVADGIAELIDSRRDRHVQPRRRRGRLDASTSSPTSPARTSAARARRTRRRAARPAPRPTSTARSTCRTSTWRSCSTTPARASCSGCGRRSSRPTSTRSGLRRRPRAGASAARPRDQARGTYAASS